MWDKADRILTKAALAYIHVCYVAFMFFAYGDLWGRHSDKIVAEIMPHTVVSGFLTLVLMVCYVMNKPESGDRLGRQAAKISGKMPIGDPYRTR